MRVAGRDEVFAVCAEICDGPGGPWWVGVGTRLTSLTASSPPAKTTLRFTRNTELVVTALTGQPRCHRRFSKGWDADGLLGARRLKDMVPSSLSWSCWGDAVCLRRKEGL